MIKQTEEPTREAMPEPMLGGYRLDPTPRRREGGSLLFSATASDGSPASLQVSADPVTSRRVRSRFRRVARARADLGHPALLGVRETGEEGGRLFLATDPFPARSLADLLRSGPLDPDLVLRMLTAVADGLDAAHAKGLVHRTFSAESVLLDGERVKLDLFGLFTVIGQASWGDVVRRDPHLHYESPEALQGGEPGPRSNVYSLAGLLFHALTGDQPFPHHDPVMITYAHVSQPPPKVSERKPGLPAGLDAVVARGMAKDPAERPESAGALIRDAALALRVASWAAPKPAVPKLVPPESAPKPAKSPPLADAAPPAPAPAPPAKPPPPADAAPPAPPAKPRVTPAPAAPVRPVAPGAPASPAPVASAAPTPSASAPPALPASRPPGAAPRATVPPTLPADAAASSRPPLRARLAPWGPALLVLVVAAVFGALLGMPGSGSERAADTVRSPDQLALQRLDGVRFRLRDDLAVASTTEEQANLAQRLAMAYGHAADALRSPKLVSAAESASAAYASLESAARAADQDAYDVARGDVEAAESRIAIAIAPSNSQSERK
jgi:serine/threonine kinase PknH